MAIDMQAKLAELRAKKAAEAASKLSVNTITSEITTHKKSDNPNDKERIKNTESESTDLAPISSSSVLSGGGNNITVPVVSVVSQTIPTSTGTFAPAVLGTTKTTEIDHLQFLDKLNSLQDAMLTQHPTMPVLLMQIHKQLMADPELVTVLNEEAIGLIVKGLQVQTKTELVQVTLKSASSSSKKKAPLSVDMF